MSDADSGGRPLVLVAEDEPIASMALRAQLEVLDYQVLGPARNGDEAVALGACFPVDVALLDVRMPGRSGLEAAHDLFELAPTPIALLTGVGSVDLPDPLPTPPIFTVINKPAGLQDLADGLDAARTGFDRWRDRNPEAPTNGDDPRHLIARAVQRLAPDDRHAAAAARLLQRALDEGRTPAAVARDILDQDAP